MTSLNWSYAFILRGVSTAYQTHSKAHAYTDLEELVHPQPVNTSPLSFEGLQEALQI